MIQASEVGELKTAPSCAALLLTTNSRSPPRHFGQRLPSPQSEWSVSSDITALFLQLRLPSSARLLCDPARRFRYSCEVMPGESRLIITVMLTIWSSHLLHIQQRTWYTLAAPLRRWRTFWLGVYFHHLKNTVSLYAWLNLDHRLLLKSVNFLGDGSTPQNDTRSSFAIPLRGMDLSR